MTTETTKVPVPVTDLVEGAELTLVPAFVPVSSRIGRALIEGAGLSRQNVLACSLEVGAPGECVLNVKYDLPAASLARVLAALGAIDPEAPQ